MTIVHRWHYFVTSNVDRIRGQQLFRLTLKKLSVAQSRVNLALSFNNTSAPIQ